MRRIRNVILLVTIVSRLLRDPRVRSVLAKGARAAKNRKGRPRR